MQERTLTCGMRTEFRTSAAKRLRLSGKIPAIIYGRQQPVAISVDAHEFQKKFRIISENVIINIKVDNDNYDVLIKDYQEDLIKDRITHIDFFEIDKAKTLKTKVPVHISGTAVGVKIGGIFEFLLHEVEVECLPKDLPEKIEVDITNLELGQSIHIKDIVLEQGVKITNPDQQVICHVIKKKEVVEKPEEEAAEEAATAATAAPAEGKEGK